MADEPLLRKGVQLLKPPLRHREHAMSHLDRFVVENGQKTIWGSCENVIFIRNAGTNPKVMAVGSKVNVNQKNLIMSLADSCFEFLRDLEKENESDLVRHRAAEFTEDVRDYSRLIELT